MNNGYFTVQLAGECSSIGDGTRTVFAAFGRKWVTIVEPFTLHRNSIPIAKWAALRPVARDKPKKVDRYIKDRMRHETKSKALTKLIKEMK